MAMYSIELKNEAVEVAINRLIAALADKTPVMQDIGEALLASTEERYDQGVAPDGTPWLPKSIHTVAAYESGNDRIDYRPLFKTGTMRRTLFTATDADQAEIGSNAIQAAVMQFGASKGAFGTASNGASLPFGDIPARPFLGISDQDRSTVIEIVEEWLQDAADD